jgi:hypothetical protein
LQNLRSQLNGTASQPNWPHRPMTEEEAIAFHESSEWVRKYVENEREKDRRRVNAAIDRQIEREKKTAARKTKAGTKTRKAG